ncbi:MAG TPA: hypothetical protein DC049_20135, partial [Spirochaetia bacterium]|nr:hypothetical protein [Spirochaetia bacterium]
MKHILILLFFLLNLQISSATFYYLDAAGGNDTNSGLSPTASWKTLDKLNNTALLPGDKVLFKRGEKWRGQIISRSGSETGGVVTYSDYGPVFLPKPLLLGSTERNSSSDWINQGNNIWLSAPSLDNAVPTGSQLLFNPSFDVNIQGWGLYYASPASGSGGRTTGLYDTSPACYSNRCVSMGTAGSQIQFYTTSNITISSGKYYLLSFRARCTQTFTVGAVKLQKKVSPYTDYGICYEGVQPQITTAWTTHKMLCKAITSAADARITFYLGASLPAGAILYIDSLSFTRCELPDGRLPLDIDIGNIIFNEGESCGSKVWSKAELDVNKSSSSPIWIQEQKQGRFWYDTNHYCVYIYSTGNPALYYRNIELARKDYIFNQGSKNYILYENLHMRYGGSFAFAGGSTHHISIRSCDMSFIGGALQYMRDLGGGNYQPVRYGNAVEFWANAHDNLVENCKIWEVYDAGLTDQGGSNSIQYNLYYRNNIVWNCEYAYEFFLGENSLASNIYVENNTFANSGYGFGHFQRTDSQNGRLLRISRNLGITKDFYVRNNILAYATESCLNVNVTFPVSLDYNIYYQNTGNIVDWQGITYTMDSFSQYTNNLKQDIHSLAANPQFIDFTNKDFHITAVSSAVDRGINSGFPADYAGQFRPIGRVYDIGAYEYDYILSSRGLLHYWKLEEAIGSNVYDNYNVVKGLSFNT